jgi:hypothetical protein
MAPCGSSHRTIHPPGAVARTFEDFAPADPDTLGRGINVADAEIEKPERELHHRGFGEHAAEGLRSHRDELIVAPCAGFSAPILPAKKRAVESKRFPAVNGEQLVPTDASYFALGRGRLLGGVNHLTRAIVVICGSVTTATRLTPGTSVGGR